MKEIYHAGVAWNFVHEKNEDGTITYTLDENGEPILTQYSKKLMYFERMATTAYKKDFFAERLYFPTSTVHRNLNPNLKYGTEVKLVNLTTGDIPVLGSTDSDLSAVECRFVLLSIHDKTVDQLKKDVILTCLYKAGMTDLLEKKYPRIRLIADCDGRLRELGYDPHKISEARKWLKERYAA